MMSGLAGNRLYGLRSYPALGLFLLVSSTFAADMAPVDFGSIAAGDLGMGWSGPKQDGELKYRIAEGEKTKTFFVKVWWKDGDLRPPEGTAYILQLRFKDTFTTPAVFSVAAGLGKPSELHRFGGSGDGEWKTANIPVTWEYLCRKLNPLKSSEHRPKHIAFGIRSSEPVPVAKLKPRPLQTGDRERYFAEIRAFNHLEQKADRIATPYPSSSGVIEGETRAAVPYHWDRPDNLFPNFKPEGSLLKAPIKIRMCINEIQPAAFGVYANGQKLEGVDFTVSELKGENGTLKAEIIRRTTEYSLVFKKRRKKNRNMPPRRWLPVRLWPAYAVDIPEGTSHHFVANVRTIRNQTKAGTYKGTITVTHSQGKETIPLEVEVLPIDLLTMDEADLHFGGCVQGLVPVSDVAFQLGYNQNIINLWYSAVRPHLIVIKPDGSLKIDYTYIEDFMSRAKKAGCRQVVYHLGGSPTKFPTTATLALTLAGVGKEFREAPDRWRKIIPKWQTMQAKKENRTKLPSETRVLYKQWVKQVMAHSRKNDWPELILTPLDEPAMWTRKKKIRGCGTGPWIRDWYKDVCAAIHEADPKVRVYSSIHDLRKSSGICFLPDTDVFCTNAVAYDEKAPEKVRKASEASVANGGKPKAWWQYTFSGSNRPEYIHYSMGFCFGHYDARGGLIWAYNWEKGWNRMQGKWRYAWQTPLGTIPGYFFEGVREGLDDRRIMETYKRQFKNDKVALRELKDLLQEARDARGESGTSTVTDFWTGIKDSSLLKKWRYRLLDRMAGKQKTMVAERINP